MRDKNGLCVLCKPGEPGEFIGKIVKNHPSRGFDGYVDKEATQKKIAHDVMYVFMVFFPSSLLITQNIALDQCVCVCVFYPLSNRFEHQKVLL